MDEPSISDWEDRGARRRRQLAEARAIGEELVEKHSLNRRDFFVYFGRRYVQDPDGFDVYAVLKDYLIEKGKT